MKMSKIIGRNRETMYLVGKNSKKSKLVFLLFAFRFVLLRVFCPFLFFLWLFKGLEA